ncbi:MAG TPA: DUF6011 domain-containing protein [Pseudonocardiaceae bacterium]
MTSTTTNITTRKCGRCGRTLTAPRSVANGYGRACQTKITTAAKAAATTYKPVQVAKAVEVVELGGIVRADRPATYLAVSSDGTTVYRVDHAANTCTCPAGENGRACYHLAAASLLAA